MYARLTQYLFRIEDQRRWVDNLKRLQARREHENPEGLALVAGLEGCRGVWFLVPDDDPPYEELIKQGEDLIQRGEVGSFEQRETFLPVGYPRAGRVGAATPRRQPRPVLR